jgi:acyl-[acyl-carrier-protein]-phospholipid O-acyltransferase/long-chain-fatty-acid--[acyl-carrier-protein] ligase
MLKNKAFWSLFGAHFFGTFNDNFFRTALVTLITYHITIYSNTTKALFVSLAFGLFMLPFFLLSPLAGQLSDHFDKSRVIRAIKAAEIMIVSVSTYGFVNKDPYFLLGALFLMGIHTTFFNPVRFSILPDILPTKHLLGGNGYMEGGNFLSIMLGTLFGALMIQLQIPLYMIGFQLSFFACLGFIFALQIPKIPISDPHLKIDYSWFKTMKALYGYSNRDKKVLKSIICISWFWLVGSVLLAQLPNLAKDVLNLTEGTFIFLLLLFTIGIGAGSIICNWYFKGEITVRQVPLFSLIMIPFLFDIASFRSPFDANPMPLSDFLTSFHGLELTFDFLGISFVGGLFIVPLYAYIQAHVAADKRSQVIAFNNIINAGFIVFASFSSFCFLSIGIPVPALIFMCAVGQVLLTIYVTSLNPKLALP